MDRAFKIKLPCEKGTAIAGDLMQLNKVFHPLFRDFKADKATPREIIERQRVKAML
jgi:hypothetical protein